MSTEPEAIRLANLLQDEAGVDGYVHDEAAAMLRKLVAEREADRAAMRRADRALMVAKGTLVELSPCAADDCKQDQTDLMRLAEKTIAEARTDLRQRLEGTT